MPSNTMLDQINEVKSSESSCEEEEKNVRFDSEKKINSEARLVKNLISEEILLGN